MNNKEWLGTLSNEQYYEWLTNDWEKLKEKWEDNKIGMLAWLEAEHVENPIPVKCRTCTFYLFDKCCNEYCDKE